MPNFTKKAIVHSFLKLLNERPLNKITVKDIVDDCGINRNSFYYHFEDIPGLMKSLLTWAVEKLVEKYSDFETFEDCMRCAIQFIVRNQKSFLHIYNSTYRGMFEQYLWDACQYCVSSYVRSRFAGYKISESDRSIIINYYKCTLYGQISAGLAHGMREDILEQYKRLMVLSGGMMEEMFRRCEENCEKS